MAEKDFGTKIIDTLIESEKHLQSAEHLASEMYELLEDPKILLKALESSHKSIVLSISCILKIEHVEGKLKIGDNSIDNLDMFFEYCANNYIFDKRCADLLKEEMFFARKHRESGLEFTKDGRIIILDDDLRTYILSQEKMMDFVTSGKILLENANLRVKNMFS